MTYRLGFTPKARKQIERLDRAIAQRIKRFLTELDLANPRRIGKALAGDSGVWRYRVGDYRILAAISDDELLVLVVEVGHRSRIYREV